MRAQVDKSRLSSDSGGRRTSDESRIVQRLKRLSPQMKALALSLRPFDDQNGHFGRDEWSKAFNSQEPEDIVDVKAVTGLYVGLVNHLTEMLRIGAKLVRLAEVQASSNLPGPALFAAVTKDGGLTLNKFEVLKRLYKMRNDLEHSSPGVDANDVYDDVILLQKTLGGFASSYVKWLDERGIQILPRKGE